MCGVEHELAPAPGRGKIRGRLPVSRRNVPCTN